MTMPDFHPEDLDRDPDAELSGSEGYDCECHDCDCEEDD